MRLTLLAFALAAALSASAATYTVNSNADTTDGVCDVANCTLREAITVANTAGGGTIHFAIGSGPVNIVTTSALPDLTTPIVLDATTQPGYAGSPIVQLTGFSTAAHCLVVRASDSVVRGLDIGLCADGIAVLSNTGAAVSNIAIERNFIGTRLSTATINGRAISLNATGTSTLSNVTIGNGTAAGRNLLATFGFVADAIAISGNTSDVTVAGNYIGIDEAGTALQTASRFTTDIGIYGSASSSNIHIGGPTAGARNVLASGGGTATQVHFKIDSLGSNLTIEGNYIGTDATGMIRKGASTFGVWFFGQGSATIRNNLIATNGGNAVSRGVTTTGPVVVQGNWINVKADGTAFPLVSSSAINDFSSVPGYLIGGPNPGDGNVIANYHTAVFVESPGAIVQGNLIGLDPTGTTIIGGGTRGIATSFVNEPGIDIRDNTIAGFTTGIEMGNKGRATIENNFIGTDGTGTLARPNTTGISILLDAGRSTIRNNVIAGNTSHGVLINAGTMPVDLTGNRIGVNAADAPLPNGGDGIRVTAGTGLKHVGFLAGAGNTIANNAGNGVSVTGGSPVSILGNSIFDNGGLAIDLGPAGVTPNDAGDADTGGNGLQNSPALLSAILVAGATSVSGTLNSTPSSTFTIELYANAAADPTNQGEAQTFLTRFNVVTDAGGDASFTTSAPLVAAGTILSATATNATTLETSEVSNDVITVNGGTLQFSSAAANVNESAGLLTITVTRTGGGGVPVSVQYASADGIATAGSDYTAVAGTLNFAAADASKTFDVPITGDLLDEPGETFTLTLSNVTGGTLGTPIMETVTIDDDDAMPSLNISDPAIVEGNSGTGILSFDVQLSAASGQTVTVDYATADQTATAGPDYGQKFGTLTFAPGETSKSVAVIVNGETVAEANETLRLLLTSPSNASIADTEGIGTITNDDALPAISISDVTVVEGDAGGSTATLTLTLSNPGSAAVSADWTTNASSATAGSDFTSASGSVTFNPGATVQTIGVTILGDMVVEAPEQFEVNLGNPAGGSIADSQGLVSLADDDGEPSLTISNVAVSESAGTATLTVLLAPASEQTVTVGYNLNDGTATAPTDYTDGSATLTFNPGVTSQTFTVPITSDNVTEGVEAFGVSLSAPANAAIANGNATVTIIDDDGTPNASIDDINVIEGNGGTVSAGFTVALSNPSASTITMNWTAVAGTASAGSDFTLASGSLTFNSGETSKPVVVFVNGDAFDEPDETFFVVLSGATNAILTRAQGTATIVNDDGTPALVIDDASRTEGNAGTAAMTFTVTLAGSTAQTVTVDYAVAGGTAVANSDFAPVVGQLTFAPGVTTQTIDVPVVGDLSVEPDETLFVNLSAAVHATISDNQALGTILDDDVAAIIPSISIGDLAIAEGNAGTSTATFTVTLSQATTNTVTVDYATSNASAIAGSDYGANSGALVFAPGVTSQTISIAIAGDTNVEPDETFFVDLANAANATIADAQAAGTILNDDSPAVVPSISISDASAGEGNSGTTPATFNVTLSAATTTTVTVSYATANGSATAGSDYAAASGTLVFAPGVTSQPIIVAVAGDTTVEPDETFFVNLSAPVNGTLGDAQGAGTIVNDDSAAVVPSISIDGDRVTEGNSGTRSASFAVRLSASAATSVTIDYATHNGSAVAGTDFVAASGTVVFPAGATLRTITVAILGDTIDESNETFTVRLTNPSGATIADGQATGTIVDDDEPAVLPSLTIADAATTEGNSGTTPATFVVTLSTASAVPVTVEFETADGTATAGADYAVSNGTLVFAPGETSRSIPIAVVGDTAIEPDETFTLVLTRAVGASLAGDRATGTIRNDDGGSAAAVLVIAGSGPGMNGSFFRTTLQLLNPGEAGISGNLIVRPMGGGPEQTFGYALRPREAHTLTELDTLGGFVSIDLVPLSGDLPQASVRVYNDAGAQGTSGFTTELVPMTEAVTAGQHAALIAPANATAMRYNVGVRALREGASIAFTLHRASGDVASRVSRSFAPNVLMQTSAAALFGVALADTDWIEIVVTEGSAIVYGSAIDNITQDSAFGIARRVR